MEEADKYKQRLEAIAVSYRAQTRAHCALNVNVHMQHSCVQPLWSELNSCFLSGENLDAIKNRQPNKP